MGELLDTFGDLGQAGDETGRWLLRLLALITRRPGFLIRFATYGVVRSVRERRMIGSVLAALLRFRPVRVRPLIVVVHRFMNGEELGTAEGRERLEACVFRVPVDGKLVSMCELNATDLRLEQNRANSRKSRLKL